MSTSVFVLFKQGAYAGSENKTQSSQPVLISKVCWETRTEREWSCGWWTDLSKFVLKRREMGRDHVYAEKTALPKDKCVALSSNQFVL